MASSISRLIIGVLLCSGVAAAQSQLKEGTGAIAGRVTLGGKPAQGVIVTLSESGSNDRKPLDILSHATASAKATTDAEGSYRFSGLADGVYEVAPFAPTLVSSGEKSISVTLGAGTTVDDIDFSLSKGGVITGRVTTKQGRPVVMETVQASPVNQSKSLTGFIPGFSFTTDDRGVYRIYGLSPGRYRVSVGRSNPLFDGMGPGMKRPAHPVTFHPGVTEEARAVVVELAAGAEASNIDIKLGDVDKTYSARGRVVDADTNKPIPNAVTSYRITGTDSADPRMPGMSPPTSPTGEFRLEGLAPGQYVAFCFFGLEGSSEFYSDHVSFEVKSDDVSGLEIKAHRGLSISGVAVIEGTSDPAVLQRLGQTDLFAFVADQSAAPNFARCRISGDGSFQLRGLRPGRARLMVQDFAGLRITRIERSGVPQPQGIDVAAGDQITDIRVVIQFPSGIIRGQVNVDGGGQLPKGARLSVGARRNNDSSDPGDLPDHVFETAEVDSAGHFVIQGLIPGEYEVTLTAVLNPSAPASGRQIRQVRQQVVVGDSPTETVLVLDLGKTTERD